MGIPTLGTKCTCVGCSARFYDLNRLPATCPKCGAQQPARATGRRAAPAAVQPRRAYRPPDPAPVLDEHEASDVVEQDVDTEEDEADVDVEADFDDDAGVAEIGKVE